MSGDRIAELLSFNNEFESRARRAEQSLRAAIELIAKGIYDQWREDPVEHPGWVGWVPWGNSRKQDEARAIACRMIEDVRRKP